MSAKERIDVLLVNKGLCSTREKAKSAIMAGLVFADLEKIEKPGMKIPVDSDIHLKRPEHPYVGRGGLKLEKAIQHFNISMQDRVVLDIGASTGGFTDCALQHGAAHVYALDVGTNQLAWSLRNDERVTVMERTNFRYVKPDAFHEPKPDLATIDVSFISTEKILPPLWPILAVGNDVIMLIKPQFEAGREQIGKSGVIRDRAVHRDVLLHALRFIHASGFKLLDLTTSPITGGDGNVEFLAHLNKTSEQFNEPNEDDFSEWENYINKLVEEGALK